MTTNRLASATRSGKATGLAGLVAVAALVVGAAAPSSASVSDALPTGDQVAKLFQTQPLQESQSKDDRLYLCWYNPIVQPHEVVSTRINRRFSGAAKRIKEVFKKGGGPYDIAACKTATKDNIEVRITKLNGKKRFGKQAHQVTVIYRRDKLGSEWGQWASTSVISAAGKKKFVVTRYYTDRPWW